MSNAYRFIHRHTRNTLVARRWPAEMDIQTNLSYSQGDGVAFYGRLSANELVLLLPEIALRGLMDDGAMQTLRELIAGSDMSVTLYRNSLGNHHAHNGTISMEYHDCPEGMYERHVVSLLKALRAEINNVCSCVAAAGYRVLEALVHPEVNRFSRARRGTSDLPSRRLNPLMTVTAGTTKPLIVCWLRSSMRTPPTGRWKSAWRVVEWCWGGFMSRTRGISLDCPFAAGLSANGCVRLSQRPEARLMP